jgi:hypothetical protein
MPQFYLQSVTVIGGIGWTGTAPGAAVTASGTVATNVLGSLEFSSVEVSIESEVIDFTHFAAAGWKQIGNGLQSGSVTVTLNDGYSASEADAIFGLGGTLGIGVTPIYFDIKPTSAARSTTNPSLVMRVLNQGNTLGGGVGSKAERTLTFPTTGVVSRLTA